MNAVAFASSRSKSVLLFDKHPLSRHGAAAALERANSGWNVVTASRLPELLRASGTAGWGLLLLDMPSLGADAEELLQVFRGNSGVGRIAVLNGPEDAATRDRVTATGVDGYLSEFASAEELSALATSLLSTPVWESAAAQSYATRLGLSNVSIGAPARCRPDFFGQLTSRQATVFSLMAEGRSTKEIARLLGLAVGTVKAHLAGTYRALGAKGRLDALVKTGMIKSLRG